MTSRSFGQRAIGHEPCRSRSRPKGGQGPGSASYSRGRQSGPPLHLRRRPGGGIVTPMEHPSARNDDFNLSDGGFDDRAGTGRADLAQDQGPGSGVPLRSTRPSSTMSRDASRQRRRRRRFSASRRPRSSMSSCSTKSSRGSGTPWKRGPSDATAVRSPQHHLASGIVENDPPEAQELVRAQQADCAGQADGAERRSSR